MSKRCELQKEYHREHGNYKGVGKYSDHYVNWLESKILALNIQNVSNCYACGTKADEVYCDVCYCEGLEAYEQ